MSKRFMLRLAGCLCAGLMFTGQAGAEDAAPSAPAAAIQAATPAPASAAAQPAAPGQDSATARLPATSRSSASSQASTAAQASASSQASASGQPSASGSAVAQSAESVPASLGDDTLDAIKKKFDARFPEIEATAVARTPFPGLYEIQIGANLVYTDAKVDYLLQGSLIDTKSRTDLTSERMAKLSEVTFDKLPLNLAVKQVRGNGARKMAVFEDPNCVFCKRLHHTLESVDNVTVYTFLFPVLSPDSVVKARDIWCAQDRAATWRAWMVDGKKPPSVECKAPVEQVLALGKKLMVQGTPAIIFSDGTRADGALPLQELEQKLDSLG